MSEVRYAAAEDVAPRLPEFDVDSESDVATLEACLADATSLVDARLGFALEIASEATEGERTFYGRGHHFLRVDPFDDTADVRLAASSVTMPDGYEVPAFELLFDASRDARAVLRALSADGNRVAPGRCGYVVWPEGVPVTISASWGYKKVPRAIRSATVDTAIALYRATYAAPGKGPGRVMPQAACDAVDGWLEASGGQL